MKKYFLALIALTTIGISSCTKQAIQTPANTNSNVTPVKKTRTIVVVITMNGVYKYISDTQEGCVTWDAKCYRDIIVMNSSTVMTGVGPNGENDGNFEITTGSQNPGELTIYKETGEWNTTFTHFISRTAEGYSSIFNYQ